MLLELSNLSGIDIDGRLLLFLNKTHRVNKLMSLFWKITTTVLIVLSTYGRVRIDPVGSLAGVIEKAGAIGLGLNEHVNDGLLVLGDLQIVLLLLGGRVQQGVVLAGLDSGV